MASVRKRLRTRACGYGSSAVALVIRLAPRWTFGRALKTGWSALGGAIADAVRQRLAEEGLDGEEVARRCVTSPEVVRSLQAGRIPSSFDLLVRLAVGLGVRLHLDARA